MRLEIFACAPFFAAVVVADLRLRDLSNNPDWENFLTFVKKYKKGYLFQNSNDELVQKRFKAFTKNAQLIKEHNAEYDLGHYTYTLGENYYMDLEADEFKNLMGYKSKDKKGPASSSKHDKFCPPDDKNDGLPPEFNWREKGVVTPVKDQGSCGACWAFTAIASMESVYAIKTGKLVSFSEQELVDCTLKGANICTHGGFMDDAFNEIIKNHNGQINTEYEYPYTATSKGVCHSKDKDAFGHFTGYKDVHKGCESALKNAVATKGVVSVGFDASSHKFDLYKSGIYNQPDCATDAPDHAFAVVGYGANGTHAYWLVKNSWGTSWGMNGYMMASRNKNNQCGIASLASYPIMED